MKFIDQFKIALHNVINSKSRSILTIIIVFIISALIMVLLLLSINFATNANRLMKEYFNQTGSNAYVYSAYDENNPYDYGFTNEEIDSFNEVVSKYTYLCDSISYGSLHLNNNDADSSYSYVSCDTMLTNYEVPYGFEDIEILEGRFWNTSDAGTNRALVSREFLLSCSDNDLFYSIGDKMKCSYEYYYKSNSGDNTWGSKKYSTEFEIIGVFDSEDSYTDMICDVDYAVKTFKDSCTVSYIEMTYKPPKDNYDFDEVYSEMEAFMSEINQALELSGDNEATASIISSLTLIRIISIAIIALAAILSLVILLLSVGSIANTIIISVDKNKKSLGLMKALGLNHKNVNKLVKIEALITIVLGIILSTVFLLVMKGTLENILTSMMNSIFAYELYELESFAFTFSIPVYIPIITIVVFILMALLFSRGSLRNLAKMDVISIISEVS